MHRIYICTMDNAPVVVRTLAEAREWIANRKMRKRVRLRRIGYGAYGWGDFVVGKREAVGAHGVDVSPREIEREKCPGCKQRVPVEAICCFCDLCMENNDGMACCGCDERWDTEISGRASNLAVDSDGRQEAQPSGVIPAPIISGPRRETGNNKGEIMPKRITLWCKNDDIYYATKKEALDDIEQGDQLARVVCGADSFKQLLCDALNHNGVVVDEKIVIETHQER